MSRKEEASHCGRCSDGGRTWSYKGGCYSYEDPCTPYIVIGILHYKSLREVIEASRQGLPSLSEKTLEPSK